MEKNQRRLPGGIKSEPSIVDEKLTLCFPGRAHMSKGTKTRITWWVQKRQKQLVIVEASIEGRPWSGIALCALSQVSVFHRVRDRHSLTKPSLLNDFLPWLLELGAFPGFPLQWIRLLFHFLNIGTYQSSFSLWPSLHILSHGFQYHLSVGEPQIYTNSLTSPVLSSSCIYSMVCFSPVLWYLYPN
jgi:hypothetical protein